MAKLRFIVLSIVIILLSEAISLTAVTWSFLESATSSFSFIKTASDNRARDTIVSLAKVSEARMNPRGFTELDQTFQRLKDVVADDVDGFRIQEVVLVSPKGIVLASSEHSLVEEPIAKRAVSEKFSNEVYTRALRMRKWQYPDTILLEQPSGKIPEENQAFFINLLSPMIDRFFSEANETIGLVSSAVYHETKLDVVAVIHLIYDRGNFGLFLQKQKEIYFWMILTYSILALVVSVIIILIIYLFFQIQSEKKSLPSKTILPNDPIPPIIEKVVVREKEMDPVMEESEITPMREAVQESIPISVNNFSTQTKPTPNSYKGKAPISNKKIVVDAIYLGEYGD